MRPIQNKHLPILSVNPDVCDKSLQFVCAVSGAGLSFVVNLIITRFGIDINFPIKIHIFHGFAKNLFYFCKDLKNRHKFEIQCYFKDILNTGISVCHRVPGIHFGKRSYISISFLGFTVYIADNYDLPL